MRSILERTKSSVLLPGQEKEAPEDQSGRVKAVTEESAPPEAGQPCKLKKEQPARLCDQEPDEWKGGSSSPSSCPFGHIDSIVERHLGHFSAEMQLVLQQQSVAYSYPASVVPPESTAVQHGLPYQPISQFSQYVSFYNPCPPVQDYVSSLQDNIESMLTEVVRDWPHRRNGDAALASEVDAFVSSIRASKEDSDGGELTAADTGVCQNPVSSTEGHVWQQQRASGDLPDAAKPDPRAAVSASSSISRPPCVSLQSHLTLQSSPTSQSSRHIPEDGVSKTASERDGVLGQTNCVSDPTAEPPLPAEPASARPPAHAHLRSPPPATALSSLIRQLQPEVFDNLMDIIKDVRRNSVQFYLHSSEPGDQVYEDVKVGVRQHEAFLLNQLWTVA